MFTILTKARVCITYVHITMHCKVATWLSKHQFLIHQTQYKIFHHSLAIDCFHQLFCIETSQLV